ncbi:MAG: hypothetical protein DMG57_31705 [Acidobacteria bacterium]|nr:MAG: hypothetical protein DMG57_31705 [Acidobacteriota bacterium]
MQQSHPFRYILAMKGTRKGRSLVAEFPAAPPVPRSKTGKSITSEGMTCQTIYAISFGDMSKNWKLLAESTTMP